VLDRRPKAEWFLAFLALSTLVFLPAVVLLGPSLWLTAGPFGIQASRVGLYAFFFVAGVIRGADRLAASFEDRWLRWVAARDPGSGVVLRPARRAVAGDRGRHGDAARSV
jgi:hypothetical protein